MISHTDNYFLFIKMSEQELTSQPQSPRSMSQAPTFPTDVVYNDTTALNQKIDEDLITVMDQEGV